eukprot:scaffold1481_cov153-Pinguiococcus_pyrenoidosus.AAC.2
MVSWKRSAPRLDRVCRAREGNEQPFQCGARAGRACCGRPSASSSTPAKKRRSCETFGTGPTYGLLSAAKSATSRYPSDPTSETSAARADTNSELQDPLKQSHHPPSNATRDIIFIVFPPSRRDRGAHEFIESLTELVVPLLVYPTRVRRNAMGRHLDLANDKWFATMLAGALRSRWRYLQDMPRPSPFPGSSHVEHLLIA